MMHGLTNLITGLLVEKMKNPKKVKEGEVHLHGLLAVLGAVAFLLFAIPAILAFCKQEALFICLLACIMPCLGLSMIKRELLSFEETARLHRQEYWPLIPFVGSFGLAWLAYVIASIVVGRNIHKYSRKTVKKFFQEENVNRRK